MEPTFERLSLAKSLREEFFEWTQIEKRTAPTGSVCVFFGAGSVKMVSSLWEILGGFLLFKIWQTRKLRSFYLGMISTYGSLVSSFSECCSARGLTHNHIP